MSRTLTRLALSVFALAAGGALAQQSQESGADIAADTREILQGAPSDASGGASPADTSGGAASSDTSGGTTSPDGASEAPSSPAAQSEPAPAVSPEPLPVPTPGGSSAQPETLRLLENSGARPVEAQQGTPDQSGGGSGLSVEVPTVVPMPDEAAMQAEPAKGVPSPEAIEAATYEGGTLPDGQSALTVKVQVLLDRAHVSPGIIDGWKGGMSESAIAAFETREGLAADGQLDQQVWDALTANLSVPMLQSYTITENDMSGLSAPLPDDYAELAELDQLGYTSVTEKLAERFHMSEDFLKALNAQAAWQTGTTITVTDPGPRLETKVARIEVRKDTSRLAGFDADGRMILNYPVTIGSSQTPSPSGTVEVVAVALDPTYTYNPDINFQQGDNDEVLILPPGPNGPVGSVWIDLSKPTYGLHGTSKPDSLFNAASHGCVRMTNWDAEELAHLVSSGVTVEFVE